MSKHISLFCGYDVETLSIQTIERTKSQTGQVTIHLYCFIICKYELTITALIVVVRHVGATSWKLRVYLPSSDLRDRTGEMVSLK